MLFSCDKSKTNITKFHDRLSQSKTPFTRCRYEMNTVWTNTGLALRLHDTGTFEYGTKWIRCAGWIDLNTASCEHPNTVRFHTADIPLATAKSLIHSFEFCFDSFIHFEINFDSLIRTGLISYQHRVDGITNLEKGIISCWIHFIPASCKRGLIGMTLMDIMIPKSHMEVF